MQIECVASEQLASGHWQAPVIFVMPALDRPQACRSAQLMARRAGADGLILIVLDTARDGFIRIANRAFQRSRSRYFGYVAEDAFAGRLWLQVALYAMNKRSARLLAFNDGKWLGRMASFGLAERDWVNPLYGGDFFHPGYRQHYADYELSCIAQAQGVFAFEPASVLVEIDWEKDDKRPNQDDKQLFIQRQATGFGGLNQQPGTQLGAAA